MTIDIDAIFKQFKKKYPVGVIRLIFISPKTGGVEWKVNADHSSRGYCERSVQIDFKSLKNLKTIIKKYLDINIDLIDNDKKYSDDHYYAEEN